MWLLRRPHGNKEVVGYLPFFLIVAAVIVFLLPGLVEIGLDGKPLGVPIRGFGVMLMLATVTAVGLAAYRAWQAGLDPEMIYSLAFVMFIAGIVGARLFYIIEYWDQFVHFTTGGRLARTSRATVLARAMSVPTSRPSQAPANRAEAVRRGSTTISSAPLRTPASTWWKKIGCVSRALLPHSTMTSVSSTSA